MQPIEQLKAATSNVHRAIEATDISRVIASEDVAEQHVRQYLACMHDCFVVAEAAVVDVLGQSGPADDWGYRLQAPELAADLEYFGISPAPPAVGEIAISDEAGAIGVLYVLQGSRFGRHMIGQKLRSQGVHAAEVSRYLLSGGIDPSVWKQFGSRVNERLSSPRHIEVASAAAINCFEAFVEHFKAEPVLLGGEAV